MGLGSKLVKGGHARDYAGEYYGGLVTEILGVKTMAHISLNKES